MSDTSPKSGYVYLLTNPTMPGMIKIGFTGAPDVEVRMKQIYSTGVPLPFECVYSKRLDNYKEAETALHVAFGNTRVNPKREFFRIDPACVMAILELLPGVEEEISEDAGITEDTDKEALEKDRKRKQNFRFSMLDINPGTILTWRRNPEIVCTVYDDRNVTFDEKVTSLSDAANQVNLREGHKCTAMPGTDWWMYGGKTLAALRVEAEEMLGN
ncbi:GIY-YIG nuclease family protein [Acetobacter senegalensis]|uniref:GIY-YIG nuclease family protein n=1 Tax=Acetobacter senegalensis TaxID=446692 RepID=UPI001EDAF641|nr:GIY-YIG nuclease family protein [Acetobacter senegalensis]MCG4253708.1 GIY-YIG nuclease family protein [Acetobacter senegalensis]